MIDWSEILLATDLDGPDSTMLFAHALKLTLDLRAHLHVVTVAEKPNWKKIPTVRDLLVKWGLLNKNATVEDYEALGLKVTMHSVSTDKPVKGTLAAIDQFDPDLLILGTEQKGVVDRFWNGSISQQIADVAKRPTLFLAHGARGMVDLETGGLRMAKILVPVGGPMPHQAAVDLTVGLLGRLWPAPAEITFLHVGREGDDLPSFDLPSRPDRVWKTETVRGPIARGIVGAAEHRGSELIIMTTRGQDSLLDEVRGTTTQRVVQQAGIPVLALPV